MTPADPIYSLPTNVGTAKLAYALANNLTVQISHMAIGDGNGVAVNPTAAWPALAREVHRAQLNQLYQHPDNPNWLVAELVIPAEVGGWTIREIALYDVAGDLIFIGNHAEQYKPVQSQGSDETKTIRMVILVSDVATVTLKTDPTTVMATIDYVQRELAKLDQKQSVRYTTTADVVLSGLGVQAGGDWGAALTAGDRVLVKNQALAKDNGVYIVAGGAWARSADADISAEVTPGLVVAVEQGATLADTRWQLVTDGLINLGTTALTFQNVTQGFAPLASPAFTGNPTAPTPAHFDASTLLATMEAVQRASGNYRTVGGLAAGAVIAAANIGGAYQPAEGGAVVFPTPASLGLPMGASVTIIMMGRIAASLQVAGGATFATDVNGATSVALVRGQVVTVAALTGTEWAVLGHSGFDASFASTMAATGSQKLPGGFLLKWASYSGFTANNTTVKTRPSAFPTALLCEALTCVGGSAAVLGANGSNATQVAIRLESTVPTSVFAISIGY